MNLAGLGLDLHGIAVDNAAAKTGGVVRKFRLSRQLLGALLALAIPAALSAGLSYAKNSGALKNTVVLIIRHAEEADKGDGLSSDGDARAKAYVKYFKSFTIEGKPLKLDHLFSAKNSTNSNRPRLTIAPTAQALGLKIDTKYKSKQVSELIREIQSLPPGATILICWHHTDIPQMLREFGADPQKLLRDGKWPEDVYGWLIQLRYDENGDLIESKRINELLLPDDSNKHSLSAPR
jgi:hypothetical protein